ncbi:uncharacterized protein [Linepithema humile]|uniref:uncharacterized protein isoform X2 n=1 Tax=Linepithema humile TaxID=83485 RepID=UPI00351E5365
MEVDLDDNFEQNVTLKLRKNRRIDNRWGSQYFVAVHDTVFGLQHLPYMPMEPPASLSEEIVESDPLYVCKQCKDCFRFQSSYEDHNKRRSWILGLWCYNCFVTKCTHMTQAGSKCLLCRKQDIDKRSYLRTRGLTRKNQKLGAIKVFYNQCQFFEHMKMHNLSIVDMGDIMLMPLPTKISNDDWSLELEIVCEALMERTFLLRMHIMDWLRLHNVEDKWWKLVNGKINNSLIEKIVEGYQGRQLFKTLDKSTINQSVKFPDNKNKDTNSHSANTISDKNMTENEDNPCMSTDITFVDCGPTSQYFEPESSVSYVPRKHNSYESMTVTKSIQNAKKPLANIKKNSKRKNASFKNLNLFETNMTSENTATNKTQSLKSYKIQTHKIIRNITEKLVVKTGFSKTMNNTTKVSVPLSANRIILPKINIDPLKQDLRTSIMNSNSKVLTIQTPKDADITSIINQLPPHLISNKKLVVMKQDSNNVIVEMGTVKETNKSILDNSTDSTSSQTKICDSIDIKKQQVADKIIIKNGKKYLIKHSRSGTENSENSSNLSAESNTLKIVKGTTSEHSTSTSMNNLDTVQNINVGHRLSLQSDISFINFTSFSSEMPSSSKCNSSVKKSLNTSNLRKVPPHLISISSEKPAEEFLFETISIIPKKDNLFMQIKIVDRLTQNNYRDNYGIVLKYRDDMINEFQRLDSFELKKRIEHLQHISEEIKKVLNFVSSICLKEKLRAVNTIKHTLERCLDKCKEDIRKKKNDDWLLNDWESKVMKTLLCSQCNKFMKPKSYVPGFSKLIEDDDKYCLCYKEVCGECLSYQETQSQLIAHQNLHKKRKPYICPDCHVSFSSSKSLEIHLWTVCFHKLKKRMFCCKICQIDGFRDMESITRHFVIMHSYTYVGCGDCLQIFRSSDEYIQHCTEAHPSLNSKRNPVRLVICKLGDFAVRHENYMAYLKMHPGIKTILWFKCPFCPLVTLKHKHLTAVLISHLRSKHLYSLSKLYSMEILHDMFGPEVLTSKLNTVVTGAESPIKMPCRYMDDTLIPKIVNTRTISSEIFERGSQNTEDTGIIHFDQHADVKPITEKADDEEKVESYKLPKILDIRSMADLEPSIAKQIETEESSQSSQIKIIKIEAEKEDPLTYKEKSTTELNDSKSNYKEETEKTKESESNSKSISSCVSGFERPLLTDTDDARINSSTESDKGVPDSESTSRTSTDGCIKVIDIRKICKPDIEPLLAVELCETQTRNKNVNYMTFIPKPPPLTRMPQHLLESAKANEPEDQSKISEKSLAHRTTAKLNNDIQEKDIDYLCHSCNEQINTSWPVVRAHFREKHSHEYTLTATATPQLLRISPDFINGGYKQFIGSKKRKVDSALSKKKRRWTPKKHTEIKEANAPLGLCVEQETAEDGEGNFKCKKCDQRCTDMANLREHIAANHRLKGRYLICLECGENFVVAPSLQMHLKAFHGIEDPINYMSQNPSYALGVDSDSEAEGRTTVANQCHVCMAVFEDKAAVDKHLRVHGMAFLNRKRIEARNAMKSPEKKISSEEDKQSTIKDNPKKTIKPAETILEKLNNCWIVG